MKWAALTAGLLIGCTGGGLPEGLREAPAGSGPRIVWDLEAEPVAEIPLPNDVATWPDPTSPTGIRLNPSQLLPTRFERLIRRNLGDLDGWGTYAAITVGFDAPIDVVDMIERQGGTDHFHESDWPEHAVYLLDLETGVPVPLDVNSGAFQYAMARPSQFWDNDPRAGESNILFETVEEDLNGNGILDPGEDTDFDGVLDHPNTIDGRLDGEPFETVDEMLWFYERETDTLFLRPILPMKPNRRYAVVITDRLVGEGGEPVRSPFEWVHHLSQTEDLEELPERFAERPHIYGDLATRGWDGVAFAWSFTTQSTTRDLDALRAGLYGEGPFARLHEEMPPDYVPYPMLDPGCAGGGEPWIAPAEQFLPALELLLVTAFEYDEEQRAVLMEGYSRLSHVAVLSFDSPYLLGDPDEPSLEEVWDIDSQTGEGRIGSERLTAMVFVPEETETQRQPFPTSIYVHGHGSNSAEGFAFAGYMLQHGVAPVFLNAQGHGVPTDPLLEGVVRGLLAEHCIDPAADAILAGRARDLDGDGDLDSGANFWTAYTFHIRDVVRQTALDHMRAIQVFRSFDGTRTAAANEWELPRLRAPVAFDGDTDGDGAADLAGDLDGDGTPDFGGPDGPYFMSGGSLGGIMTGVLAGAEPAIDVAAPIVGLGGLTDAAARTLNGSVIRAMHLRLMGPAVVVGPAPEEGSSCGAGELSMRIMSVDLVRTHYSELACAPDDLGPDDVIVVENLDNGEIGCGGAVGEAGRYRVPVPSTVDDRWRVSIYRDALGVIDFADCAMAEPRTADRVIESFETPARYQTRAFEVGDPLVAPTDGLGISRQTPEVRRMLAFGQVALDPADPINYARRVFLEPFGTTDSPARARNLFVVNTIGDQNVPLSAGNAYARASGVLPFLPHDAPEELAPWRAPESFLGRYGDLETPNDVLLEYHVLEGLSRLPRHPTADVDNFLFDVDDLSDGQMLFALDGSGQDPVDGVPPPRLDDPLRWVRETSPATEMSDAVWSPAPGDRISALANVYVIPEGIHGFDETVYPAEQFDIAQYTLNMILRYMTTDGTDLQHFTNPDGHTCLEDSSCDFFQR